jgi:1,4-dihydroxy-2-naphthoate octaprenyltransferase
MPLAYHGLGDLFVMLFFGIAAVCGTYYVQAFADPRVRWCWPRWRSGPWRPAFWSSTTCATARRTPGRTSARWSSGTASVSPRGPSTWLLLALAYAVPLTLVYNARGQFTLLLPLLSLPLAFRELAAIHRKDGAALNPHLGGAARTGLVYAALLAVGAWLTGGGGAS